MAIVSFRLHYKTNASILLRVYIRSDLGGDSARRYLDRVRINRRIVAGKGNAFHTGRQVDQQPPVVDIATKSLSATSPKTTTSARTVSDQGRPASPPECIAGI